ncbi:hypothetical protein FACS189468_4630 [Spirochaetia bacterium]|nr:hypothetical protein FACS189468_4630 [Spirochaetia bacterium]
MANTIVPESPLVNPAAFAHLNAEVKKPKAKASRGVRDTQKTRFQDIFEDAELAAEGLRDLPVSEETVRDLLDGVHSAGDELRSRPFPEEIKRYKRAVKEFIHYVVENGYTVEEQTGIPNFLKPEWKRARRPGESQKRDRFLLVQVIDQKLEELAVAIMRGQADQLAILAREDTINGLLVDLVLSKLDFEDKHGRSG